MEICFKLEIYFRKWILKVVMCFLNWKYVSENQSPKWEYFSVNQVLKWKYFSQKLSSKNGNVFLKMDF